MQYWVSRRTEVWEEEYPYKRTYKGLEVELPEELELDYDLRVGDLVFGVPIKSINVSPEGKMLVVIEGMRTELIGIEREEWIENFLANFEGWGDCPLQDYIKEIKARVKLDGELLLKSRGPLRGPSKYIDVLNYMKDKGMDTDIFLAPDNITGFRPYLIALRNLFRRSYWCTNHRFAGTITKRSPLDKIIDAKIKIWQEERAWRGCVQGSIQDEPSAFCE